MPSILPILEGRAKWPLDKGSKCVCVWLCVLCCVSNLFVYIHFLVILSCMWDQMFFYFTYSCAVHVCIYLCLHTFVEIMMLMHSFLLGSGSILVARIQVKEPFSVCL